MMIQEQQDQVVDANGRALAPLLPERHPQLDLCIADVADAIVKDLIPNMEHPFFSLSKNPDLKIRRYEHGPNWLQVTPSVLGLATIYDKDILIYCVSQLLAKTRRGEKISKRVLINSHDLLVFANRGTGGTEYRALADGMERLRGTTISTNIRTGDVEQTDVFGLVESTSVRRKHGLDGRLLSCEVVLSDWVMRAMESNEILTLHRDYFRLRKPLERRVYELARKHCGSQQQFTISIAILFKKSGSQSTEKAFRQMVKQLSESDHLPDYTVEFDTVRDMVIFRNRNTMKSASSEMSEAWSGRLDPECYGDARNVAPGWDVYYLETEWRNWVGELEIEPKHPARHFIKFCQSWYEKRGRP